MVKMLNNVLIKHAIDNVWCSSKQDKQTIVVPFRLSKKEGMLNFFKLHYDFIELPTRKEKYHLFQVGQYYPNLINLMDGKEDKWTSVVSCCNKNNLVFNLYNNHGLEYPKGLIYYKITKDKNLIFAIKQDKKIPINLGTEELFIRVYSNFFFKTEYASEKSHRIEVIYDKPKNLEDIVILKSKFNALSMEQGLTVCYINGYLNTHLDLITVKVNDCVEIVFDGSVYKTVLFTIKELDGFNSLLDNKRKYLIHYEGNQDYIDYHDDIDFHIVNQTIEDRFIGVYYHRNKEDSVRQLTHKDYAVTRPYVDGYFDSHKDWTPLSDLKIMLSIRMSGNNRKIINGYARLKDLYKLNAEDVKKAMIALDSTAPFWRADNLEVHNYPKLMGSTINEVNHDLVESVYDYHTVAEIIGNTPSVGYKHSNQVTVNIPPGLVRSRTSYEYTQVGILMGNRAGVVGMNEYIYTTTNLECYSVENLSGIGSDIIFDNYGEQFVSLDSDSSHRMYICDLDEKSKPLNNWSDVTQSNLYKIENNVLEWLVDREVFYTAVRSDLFFISTTKQQVFNNGNLTFKIMVKQKHNDKIVTDTLKIPFGELDIFLNGYSLIENIHYFVDFPSVTIVTKSFYQGDINKDEQEITIRYKGFNIDSNNNNVYGFIKHALLSRNTIYNLLNNMVQRFTIDGRLVLKKDLLFSENNRAVTIPNAANGLPYSAKEVIVPLRNFTQLETYDYRKNALEVDKIVSDYLTSKLPETIINIPNTVGKINELYSPFINKLIYDLEHNLFTDQRIFSEYTMDMLESMLVNYLPILKMCPTQTQNYPDPKYTIIHPHNRNYVITLNHYKYKLVKKAIEFYCNSNVSLTNFVVLG